MRWAGLLAALFLSGVAMAAEDLTPALEAALAKSGAPAIAALAVTREGIEAEGAAGVRALGAPDRVTLDDRWHIGSNTKAMTATLIARLAEKDVLSFDTTLAEALPDLAGAMKPAYRTVTIEQLLNHTSGIPAEGPSGFLLRYRVLKTSLAEQRQAFAAEVLTGQEPAAVPGEAFEYSNSNTIIAGAIAERMTGTPWEQLMAEEVFAPLGIAQAGFGAPGSLERLDQPRGHIGQAPAPPGPMADNPAVLGPAGTVNIAMRDWAKFALAHATMPEDFLTPESWARLHRPSSVETYAAGWGVQEHKGTTWLVHDGSNTMWYARIVVIPAEGKAVLIASNGGIEMGAAAVDAMTRTLLPRAAAE